MLFRLLTQQSPFPSVKALRAYCRSKTKLPTKTLYENNVSEDGVALLLGMMKPHPADRLNVTAALIHPWTCIQESGLQEPVQVRQSITGESHKQDIEQELDPPLADLCIEPYVSASFNVDDGTFGNDQSSSSTIVPYLVTNHNLPHHRTDYLEPVVDSADLHHTDTLATNSTTKAQSSPLFPFLDPDNLFSKPAEVEDMVQELARQIEILGVKHPDTLQAMHNLAVSYRKLTQYKEAIQLGEKVLEARKCVLDEEHPDTLEAMNNLTITYSQAGRHQEAIQLGEKVLEARKRVLGEEHSDTLVTMNILTITYRHTGRHQEAIQLGEKVLEVRKRVLDEEHPDTLEAMNNLTITYSHTGRHQEAIQLGEKLLEARKRVLGEEHSDTLETMKTLIMIYTHAGQRQEAEQLEKEMLEVQRRTKGEKHPDTIQSIARYDDSRLRRWNTRLHLGPFIFQAPINYPTIPAPNRTSHPEFPSKPRKRRPLSPLPKKGRSPQTGHHNPPTQSSSSPPLPFDQPSRRH